MRLVQLLSEIETRIHASTNHHAGWGPTARMMNFSSGIARLSLEAHPGSDRSSGDVTLQSVKLADGSLQVKARVALKGSNKSQLVLLFEKPHTNWASEAARVADAWLGLQPETPLAAMAG